jgi:hypothetical protein
VLYGITDRSSFDEADKLIHHIKQIRDTDDFPIGLDVNIAYGL